jgi:N-acyl-D-aspartate/D-glutamate deacylase
MNVDIVFRSGTVVDGTGAPPFVGDVAIRDGKIAAVGPPGLALAAAREVDATGKHLMPGWTDVHTHYDAQCMWDPLLSPSGSAGVTTVVAGNCGVGCAPTRATEEDREFMISTLGAIEDIPADVLRQGTQWEVGGKAWESFPEYLAALDQLSYAVDIACLVPHSCVRPYVLGVERADQVRARAASRAGGLWGGATARNLTCLARPQPPPPPPFRRAARPPGRAGGQPDDPGREGGHRRLRRRGGGCGGLLAREGASRF